MALDNYTQTLIKNALAKQGINNPFVVNGIIAQASTESNFKAVDELSYANTPVSRLRTVFGTKLVGYSDDQLNALRKDDIKFFDIVYGGLYGNTSPGDGFKYRGRGINQLTFKSNYQRIGNAIGVDLVRSPDLLLELPIATLALAAYYKETFAVAKANGSLQSKVGVSDISQIKNNEQGVKAAVQANAGFGSNLNTPFFTGVYNKALEFIRQNPDASAGGGVVIFLLTLGAFFFTN